MALIWEFSLWGVWIFLYPLRVYFGIMLSFFSIFTGNSKSCGLSPECNIHCYVLDVSMPKHTMHCTPDLVTVLPRRFIYGLCMWLCCWLVDLKVTPLGSVSLYDTLNMCLLVWGCVCGSWVCMAYWKTIRPNQNPQKTKKRTVVNWCFNALLQIFESLFSVLL